MQPQPDFKLWVERYAELLGCEPDPHSVGQHIQAMQESLENMRAALRAVVMSLDALGDIGHHLTARRIAANELLDQQPSENRPAKAPHLS